MSISTQELTQVGEELKRFSKDLNLSEEQKNKLHVALVEAHEKVAEYLKKNPNTTKADIIAKVKSNREEIGKRVAAFLTPEQMTKWTAEVAKAKEFLGHKIEG